jgi:UDP-3-O-[3-hydroxymyristoyl] glucosamine N-acyltransferase
MASLTAARIADLCGGELRGDASRLIRGANSLEDATPDDVSFVSNHKAAETALSSRAGCLIVPRAFDAAGPWCCIHVDDPRAAFARALSALYPPAPIEPGVHPTAIISAAATIAPGCFIGAYVVIGAEVRIGNGCSIGEGCSVGDSVAIGDEVTLHPNVTLYDRVRIGSRVILHSGCVIGADGFGFNLADDRYEKFPQIGTVEIGDDVEIGANCCIDRATLGATRIGDGTKLDNLVHVGHNCVIGKHVVVAAQTGFSGGVIVGDYAVIGGQAGIGEKAKIAPKSVVGGKAGILPSQRIRAGEPVWGIPARPLRQHLKGLANLAKVAELREEVRELKRICAGRGWSGADPEA